jgi:FkbM family methyltransferase
MSTLSDLKQTAAHFLERHHPAGLIRYALYTGSANQEPELWLVPKLVNRSGVALDIGGNAGVWCLQMARFAGEVHCFEPNPVCIRALERVLPRRATLHHVALSEKAGVAELRFDPGNTGVGTIEAKNTLTTNAGIKSIETIAVPTARLDDFAIRNVALIKIDVEGHEEAVLAGAIATLERERPAVICEIEERHNPGGLGRIRAFFATRGYRAAALDRGRLRELGTIEAEGKLPLAAAGGIYNFVFLHGVSASDLIR